MLVKYLRNTYVYVIRSIVLMNRSDYIEKLEVMIDDGIK